MAKIYQLHQSQDLAWSLEQAWQFFSDPANLNQLTPPELQFRIMTEVERPCYAGQLIAYRIRVAPAIWMSWLTEISACVDKEYFIDEQRQGPYKLWHHRHSFKLIDDGHGGTKVRMTDTVTYQLYGGIIGRLMHCLWIERQLKHIFRYRYEVLAQLQPPPS